MEIKIKIKCTWTWVFCWLSWSLPLSDWDSSSSWLVVWMICLMILSVWEWPSSSVADSTLAYLCSLASGNCKSNEQNDKPKIRNPRKMGNFEREEKRRRRRRKHRPFSVRMVLEEELMWSVYTIPMGSLITVDDSSYSEK